MASKNWKNIGEVTKTDRPINSLLSAKIDFDQRKPFLPVSADIEVELKKLVKQRIKEKNYDNFKPTKIENKIFEDVKEEDVEEYEEDMTKEEMIALFWKIDNELTKMCDFSNFCALGVEKDEKKIFEERKKPKKNKDEKIIKELAKNRNVRIVK